MLVDMHCVKGAIFGYNLRVVYAALLVVSVLFESTSSLNIVYIKMKRQCVVYGEDLRLHPGLCDWFNFLL